MHFVLQVIGRRRWDAEKAGVVADQDSSSTS